MFKWYSKATKCYVYMNDVSIEAPDTDMDILLYSAPWESAFRRSTWFTREWTLQELLASPSVEFFSAEGLSWSDVEALGSPTSLQECQRMYNVRWLF